MNALLGFRNTYIIYMYVQKAIKFRNKILFLKMKALMDVYFLPSKFPFTNFILYNAS